MGTGTVGHSTRAAVTAKRTALLTLVGAAVVVGALLFPFSAPAHDASDFFIFARTLHGPAAETNCNGSSNNNKQADVSGSTNIIHGRIHSNADYHAGGQNNNFHSAVTYGTEDTDCAGFAGVNTYHAGAPTDLNGAVPSGVNNGWPGDLNTYVDNGWQIDTVAQALPGETCDVGSLSNNSDYTVTAADNGKVICRGTGKVQLSMSNVTLAITILSHGPIEISGQNVTLTPAVHGILAFTDYKDTDFPIKLAGSNFTVPVQSILFATKAGIDTSGSDDSEMCIQLIGQGWIRVPGSTNILGPGSSACKTQPAPGKIVIEKQTDPANYPTTFDFTGEIVATLADNQTAEKSVAPGTYTVTESEKVFWDVYAITCDDANSTGNVAQRRATFNVEAGETVKCTFFNRKRGDITVVKQTNPDGDPQPFSFSASWDANGFSLTDGQSEWSGALVPGTYSVSETVPEGWMLESATCDDGSPVNAIQLDPTEDVVCTFVNTKRAKVIVKKVMVGGSASFPFTGTPNGSIAADHGTIEALVAPGQYVSTEGAVAGWDLTGVTCDDQNSVGSVPNGTATFNVTAGEIVTCTFTNTKRSTIVVEKVTVGGDGTFAFDGPGAFDPSLGNGETAQLEVVPGSYTVSETVPSGWDLTGIVCDDGGSASPSTGDVPPAKSAGQTGTATYKADPGETVRCTFTNTKRPDITVEKLGNGPVTQGEAATFEITITNNGPTAATGVELEDTLVGSGWEIVDETEVGKCKIELGVLSCENITLAVGGQFVVTVSRPTTPQDCGSIPNTVRVSAANEDPQGTAPNTDEASIVVLCPDVSVVKTPDDAVIQAGETATFKIVVTNTGTGSSDVTFDDQLPDGGLDWSTSTPGCDVVGDPGNQDLECSFTLGAGASKEIEVSSPTTNVPDACGEKPNSVTITATGDIDLTDDTDGAKITVQCADVKVEKTAGQGTIEAGDPISFSITVTNLGPGSASNVTLNDTLPTGFEWTLGGPNAAACDPFDGAALDCEFGTLAQGDTRTVTLTSATESSDCGQKSNTATVSSTGDVQIDNNSSTATVTILCPDVKVTKTAAQPQIDAGSPITFTVEVENLGPGAASNVTLNDTLPSGFSWTVGGADAEECELDGLQLTCEFGTLAEGEKRTITLTSPTDAEDCGLVENTATVSSTGDINAENNSSKASMTIRCPGTITVKKVTIPAGSEQEFDFLFQGEGSFDLMHGQQEDFTNLDPGSYTVAEDVPDGWDLESIDCGEADVERSGATVTINLHENESVTCTFTNEQDSEIIVEKQTIPNGDQQKFTFSASWSEGTFLLGDGEQESSGDLEPGQYLIGEDIPLGWDLTDIDCGDIQSQQEGSSIAVTLGPGQVITCVFTNTKRPPGSINVIKTAEPTSVKEPGGTVNYTVTVQNTSTVDVTITSVVDDKFGNLANVAGGNPAGCFAVPFVLAPGASSTCTFPKNVTGTPETPHVNVVTVTGTDTSGNTLTDSDDARVDFSPRLIDLVIVKNATSPTPLNDIVTYTMTITNKGPDTATNVQVADPAPAGIEYLSVTPGAPTCSVTKSMLTCSLGTLNVGQSRTITLRARAKQVGRHTNTATVTGEGGRETNPADNVDNAVTVVPRPAVPPAPRPVCLTLTVTSSKMIKADGKADRLSVRVTQGKKRVKGTKVVVRGAGVKKSSRSNAKGMASFRINPKRPGVITITAVQSKNQAICGPKRIGAVGVFLPPLTG
jgi:uncharacterized repeat protein (TIGR01451 family)